MMDNNSTLTADRAREFIDYDPIAGIFRWKKNKGSRAQAGKIAGGKQRFSRKTGESYYWVIRIDGKIVKGNNLPNLIDHEDNDGLNNAFANLRPASQSQNMQNSGRRSDNISGVKGVSWDRINRKWVARIRVDGRYKNLGRYKNKRDARIAYRAEAVKSFGQFARAA